jgi:hypothetical protein
LTELKTKQYEKRRESELKQRERDESFMDEARARRLRWVYKYTIQTIYLVSVKNVMNLKHWREKVRVIQNDVVEAHHWNENVTDLEVVVEIDMNVETVHIVVTRTGLQKEVEKKSIEVVLDHKNINLSGLF